MKASSLLVLIFFLGASSLNGQTVSYRGQGIIYCASFTAPLPVVIHNDSPNDLWIKRDGKIVAQLPIEAPNAKKLEGQPYGPPPTNGSIVSLQTIKAAAFEVIKEQLGTVFIRQDTVFQQIYENKIISKRTVEFPGHNEKYVLFDWTLIATAWLAVYMSRLLGWIYHAYQVGCYLSRSPKS
jgi:hypothetical protein